MKLVNSIYKTYAQEYIDLGMRLGYFNYNQAKEILSKILNLDVSTDTTLPGDAYCNKNTLVINPKRTNNNEKLSLVLFHEFTHINSSIHKDLFGGNSLIKRLKEKASSFMDTNYYHGFSKTKIDDINNPFTYINFGGLLLDEVIAENVATEMIKTKFNKLIPLENKQKKYGNHVINYRSHFNYYGIGENIVNKFAQTLFMNNNCKNLNGLSSESFKPDFVFDLIRQHNERPDALEALTKELAYMGIIAFAEEQSQGRYEDRGKLSPELIYNCYLDLDSLLLKGREDREIIPGNIPMPSFME